MNDDIIDPRLLEAFAAVMSSGSITGGARLLGRSQPVVTRQVQDLEAEIGFALFFRTGPRITPTPQGVLFHAEVERLLAGLRHIRDRAAAIGSGTLPALRIAAIPAIAAGLVPIALASMAAALLPQNVHVQSLPTESVVPAVLSQSADFGLASLPVSHAGLDVHWVGQAPCMACVATDHPLAKKKAIALRDLAGQRLLTVANPFRLRRHIEEAMAVAGVAPRLIIDANASISALALARQGLGIAIVEPVLSCGLPLHGVEVRPLDLAIPFAFAAISPAACIMTPMLAALNGALRAAAALIPGFSFRPGTSAHEGSETRLLEMEDPTR